MKSHVIRPIAPYRLDLTVWVLRRQKINEVDRWDGQTYSRVLKIGGKPTKISVSQTSPPDSPELSMITEPELPEQKAEVAAALTKMLGLDIDLSDLYSKAASDPKLSALLDRFRGFRPPRFASTYEGLVNGISCQQLSLTVGITLLNRLAAAFGQSVAGQHALPEPSELSAATVEDLRKLGYSGRKAQNILSISNAVANGSLDLNAIEQMDDEHAASALCDIYGIGRWTAQYVELRGMGRINVYPADDLGGQSKIQRWLNLPERPTYQGVHKVIDKWAPYRGLIYFLLLLDSQSEAGLLEV